MGNLGGLDTRHRRQRCTSWRFSLSRLVRRPPFIFPEETLPYSAFSAALSREGDAYSLRHRRRRISERTRERHLASHRRNLLILPLLHSMGTVPRSTTRAVHVQLEDSRQEHPRMRFNLMWWMHG